MARARKIVELLTESEPIRLGFAVEGAISASDFHADALAIDVGAECRIDCVEPDDETGFGARDGGPGRFGGEEFAQVVGEIAADFVEDG